MRLSIATFYPSPRFVMFQTHHRITHFIAPPCCFTINPVRQGDRSRRIAQVIPQKFDQSKFFRRWKRPKFVSVD